MQIRFCGHPASLNKHKLLGLPSSPELQLSMDSITFLVCKLSILYRESYDLSTAVPIEIGKFFVKSVLLECQGTMKILLLFCNATKIGFPGWARPILERSTQENPTQI